MNHSRREILTVATLLILGSSNFSMFGRSQTPDHPAQAATSSQTPAGPMLVAKLAENLSSRTAKPGDTGEKFCGSHRLYRSD